MQSKWQGRNLKRKLAIQQAHSWCYIYILQIGAIGRSNNFAQFCFIREQFFFIIFLRTEIYLLRGTISQPPLDNMVPVWRLCVCSGECPLLPWPRTWLPVTPPSVGHRTSSWRLLADRGWNYQEPAAMMFKEKVLLNFLKVINIESWEKNCVLFNQI